MPKISLISLLFSTLLLSACACGDSLPCNAPSGSDGSSWLGGDRDDRGYGGGDDGGYGGGYGE